MYFILKWRGTVGVLWSSYFVFRILIGVYKYLDDMVWVSNLDRKFNWRGITLKGDAQIPLCPNFGHTVAKYPSKNPSDPTPTQIYLKSPLI